MRLAIVGSRNYQPIEDVRAYVRELPPGTVVISGGAPGVDSVAVAEAVKRGLAVEVLQAQWAELGRAAGFIRNAEIVDASDAVVAFWDGKSPGTANTIRTAKKNGKLQSVFRSDRPAQGELF